MSKIWKNNDIIGSADAQRWEDKADSKDLQDLQDKIETEGVDTAKRLKTGRQIALSGHVSGSTVFDGSQNVNISTTIANASTSGHGLVQLSNDTNSAKEDVAATSKAVSYKADKSVAQMWKLTTDKGLALPSQSVSSTDINDLTLPGVYNFKPSQNGPFGYSDLGMAININRYNDYLYQFFYPTFTDDWLAYRRLSKTKWSSWKKLATDEDLAKKADIDKAQMYKLTLDNGYSLRMDTNDANECIKSGFYYLTQPVKNGFDGERGIFLITNGGNPEYGFQIGIAQATGQIAKRWQVGGKWRDWVQLATADDLNKTQTTLKNEIKLKADKTYVDSADNAIKADVKKIGTDLTKATTVQLASGNNLNDYFDHNGKIAGINLIGAPIEMNGHNVIVECSSYTNTGSTQEITDLVTGVKMLRTYTSGKWTRWQKLGGIDAKVYDIVMSGGIKPSKYATGYDNKIVVYDGVAHLSLNLDTTNVTAPKITIPKELAIQLKSTDSAYDGVIELNSATANYGLAYQDGRRTLRVTNKKLGETNGRNMLYLTTKKANVKWTNATVLDVTVKGERLPNHVGYFSWYVGGVN